MRSIELKKMSKSIKISDIDVLAVMLSVIHFSIIPDKMYLLYRYCIIIIELTKYHQELHRNRKVVLLFGLYTVVLACSTIINTHSFTWAVSAIMLGMQYITMFCVFSKYARKYGCNGFTKILINVFVIVLLFNDLLMLVIPYDFTNADETYWIGNKFLVSYYHCLYACLLYVKNGSKKICCTAIMTIYAAVVAAIVHCTTGIIIATVIMVMLLMPMWLRSILQKPWIFIAALLVEKTLIWGSVAIFQNPIVIDVMVNILHKSANMTGREKLYAVTMELVKNNPLWGYGHNTDIYRELIGYGNAQNGLFHIITQAGIVGAIVYFGAVYIGIKKGKQDNTLKNYGLYMFIYGMLVGAAVEINLSTVFILGVAIIYSLNIQNKQSEHR